mmetsp:Transcript_47799/g.65093  ORF Transcript_47799/g.65093 Transcript_47799/m.65093 type:complete len:250 (-) Transcript_47799:90-839(-)|eukprot:CAMPEP_0185768124 /NCGR_PEP_ID=MMETSP1174-20130828/47638_1 /TAXON_ID=35687 /ORGANISM="Dictyocha speculum, Strain CCMP1381" /LENGTH=249 /DNA_ID=CAMNT_0028452679 /DNA_START=57 /DNA_END=806 /DNA_ORIENTATION=+
MTKAFLWIFSLSITSTSCFTRHFIRIQPSNVMATRGFSTLSVVGMSEGGDTQSHVSMSDGGERSGDIAEDIADVPRKRGRPKKAVDPNAPPPKVAKPKKKRMTEAEVYDEETKRELTPPILSIITTGNETITTMLSTVDEIKELCIKEFNDTVIIAHTVLERDKDNLLLELDEGVDDNLLEMWIEAAAGCMRLMSRRTDSPLSDNLEPGDAYKVIARIRDFIKPEAVDSAGYWTDVYHEKSLFEYSDME